MSIAKEFLAANKNRFYCDAQAPKAWVDAASQGNKISATVVEFSDGSRLMGDPMAGSIVATGAN